MIRDSKLTISSSTLHILAMGLMLCDHLWATLFPAQEWLTCIGRIAYPIFAFMIVEGYTHNVRRYMLRIFFWTCLSEIPFDIMYGGSLFYPYHQNVLWTFLLSLLLIVLIERCRSHFKPVLAVLLSAGIAALGQAEISAALINSSLTKEQYREVFYRAGQREYKLTYVTSIGAAVRLRISSFCSRNKKAPCR